MNKELKSVGIMYGITLGVLLAILVGIGITAFYDHPYSYGGNSDYGRNVLMIAFACGLLFSLIGLVLPNKLGVFRLALLIGGFFTLLFALVYPVSAGIGKGWIFGAVAVALVILVPVGYIKLTSRDRDDGGFGQD
jgi:peptidoglycan/LPS O-acetylase OafA/YrhL